MASIVQKLHKQNLINPPSFLPVNVHYEVMMGSISYGVSTDNSDIDVYGFCIPPKDLIFPHIIGEIPGFGKQTNRFEQYQQHHIKDENTKKEYDLSIYNIVKYFQLCMENNPNMIDSLFVPQFCILHITSLGNMVRDNKHLFLHKGCWHKFKGYAYSQLHKMTTKNPEGKRIETIKKFGFDVKFAYHVVRLISEVEQILIEEDLDLTRNREHLKAIRKGEVSQDSIIQWFETKEKDLEKAYALSKLPYSPREKEIKQLLLDCLEMHYGSLEKVINRDDQPIRVLKQINEILDKNRNLLNY